MLLQRAEPGRAAGAAVLDFDLVAPSPRRPAWRASASAEWWRPLPEQRRVEPLVSHVAHGAGSRLAFRALIVFTFIMLLAPQSYLPALRPFRIALVAAVLGIGACLVDRLKNGRPLAVSGREMSLAGGLVLWAAITVPLSFWPGGSTSFLLDTFFKTVATFWLLGNVVDSVPRLRKVLWGLALMAVPLALTGVKNFRTGSFIEASDPVKRVAGYEAGLTANPNDLALMLNIILALSVGLLLASEGALARGLLAGIILLQVAGVVVTFSRAGFLTLATIFVLYLWRAIRRGRVAWAATATLAAACAFAVLPGGYMERLATITNIEADPTGSAQARWGDSVAAARFVLAHPVIGAGAGMNTLALNEERGAKWVEVHNVYLQYASDLGLPGLALFLLLMFSCLKRARAVRRQAAALPGLLGLSALAEGIEIALLAFAVAAVFYPVGYHVYFFYPAGLAVAAGVLYAAAAGRPGVREAAVHA